MAKNFMSSYLDELMGRDRDTLSGEAPRKISYDDPEICPYYMVNFCPHELFVNTKADLGACHRIHDEPLRNKYYEEASSRLKSQYESDFIRFADKMISDIEAKIRRGKQRIALANGTDLVCYGPPGSKSAEKAALLSDRINALITEAERVGCEGDVEKAQGLLKLCDQLKAEREKLNITKQQPENNSIMPGAITWNPDKAMQVCEVCGSYLVIGEAQHRLDDHIMGKQHVGFAMLRKTLEEVKKQKEARERDDDERIEREREKRRAAAASNSSIYCPTIPPIVSSPNEKDRVRDRDRGERGERRRSKSRSRSRDRGRRRRSDSKERKRGRRSRSRSSRSRSRDRKDRKKRSRSREKKRKRSRSRSKKRDHRDKRDKKSHKKDRDRDRDRKSSEEESKGDLMERDPQLEEEQLPKMEESSLI